MAGTSPGSNRCAGLFRLRLHSRARETQRLAQVFQFDGSASRVTPQPAESHLQRSRLLELIFFFPEQHIERGQ